MVKPDLYLWNKTDPIFRVVNRFCILCLLGSRVGSGFSFCSPLGKVYVLHTITTTTILVNTVMNSVLNDYLYLFSFLFR
ncbi:hypothetical protein Hanom_Chr16g01519911 [Helianthus anomalus]